MSAVRHMGQRQRIATPVWPRTYNSDDQCCVWQIQCWTKMFDCLAAAWWIYYEDKFCTDKSLSLSLIQNTFKCNCSNTSCIPIQSSINRTVAQNRKSTICLLTSMLDYRPYWTTICYSWIKTEKNEFNKDKIVITGTVMEGGGWGGGGEEAVITRVAVVSFSL